LFLKRDELVVRPQPNRYGTIGDPGLRPVTDTRGTETNPLKEFAGYLLALGGGPKVALCSSACTLVCVERRPPWCDGTASIQHSSGTPWSEREVEAMIPVHPVLKDELLPHMGVFPWVFPERSNRPCVCGNNRRGGWQSQ
jgi:hypothetical protein